MKRIKRRQLKEDEFVSTFTKFLRFAKRRTRELTAAGIILVVLVSVFLVIRAFHARTVMRESALLARILEISAELQKNPERVSELEELAGKGRFARLAYLKLAAYSFEKKDTEKAESYLQKIGPEKKDLIYYQAQDLLAQVHMARGEYDKAIAIYRQIEKENPEDYTLDPVLFRMARAHEEKGEIDVALDLYRRVEEEFPQTYFGYDASQKVRELEGKK
ncbi:MAG: tetratricopeptide repeat protein [Candidatus Aminicenantales bacterium]